MQTDCVAVLIYILRINVVTPCIKLYCWIWSILCLEITTCIVLMEKITLVIQARYSKTV